MDPVMVGQLTSELLTLLLKALGIALTLFVGTYGPRLVRAMEQTHLEGAQRATAAMAVRAAEQILDNNRQKYVQVAQFLIQKYPLLGSDPALLQNLIEGAVHELKAGVLEPLEQELSAPPVPQA